MKRIDIIKQKLSQAPPDLFRREEAIQEQLSYYCSHEKQVNEVEQNRFDSFDFVKKLTLVCKIKKQCDEIKQVAFKLETHLYAPELNRLYVVDSKVAPKNTLYYCTPRRTTIDSAIQYIVERNLGTIHFGTFSGHWNSKS